MKLLPTEIAKLVTQAIQAAQAAGDLPAFDIPAIEARPPKRAEQGDYAVSVAMQLVKATGLNPFLIATKISHHFPQSDFISAVEVLHPGFINLRLSKDWLNAQVDTIIAEGENLFQLELGAGKRAQVEFVSANPTGPLHVGRSRGAIVGDSLARILEAAGYSVEREYYFNNAGVQMQNLGNSLRVRYLQALGQPVNSPDADDKTFYHGDYLIDFAKELVAEQGNALVDADWQPFKEYAEKKMFERIKTTLARVNIHHDVYFNENSLYDNRAVWDTFEALKARGDVYEAVYAENATEEDIAKIKGSEPAWYFRSTKYGDDKDRVLLKSNKEPTYTLPDIAYHLNKIARGFDVMVNVLGADHGAQYKVVHYGLTALGEDISNIHVIIVQLVRMIRDGVELKMSTRQGVYETLDELIDQTSADAVRYILLARSPDSQLDFDLDLAVKQTNENPVYYIQYAYVRCAGIMREAEVRGVNDDNANLSLLGDSERAFLRKSLELGETIEFAATKLEPHKIAFFALELASAFHPIFDNVRVLHSEVPPDVASARLRFFRAAQVVFKRALDLMGMSAPEKM
ncbi:MAG: arginine--tRNA ligase [Burkholderiales bacterium]|nr:arginine--tRNA ligase [Anaerolineae bacterium]